MNLNIKKINYDNMMEKEVENFKFRPKLLLHVCCAPCSSSVLERLVEFFDITVFFYNPNMDTEQEFEKRKNELLRFVEMFNKNTNNNIKIEVANYYHEEFLKFISGLENEREGGSRCEKCFKLRLNLTKEFAKKNKFDYFSTTLTVSPYKNAKILNEIGKNLEEENLKYLISDFKKKDGYKRSIELSKKYSLYRQDYCGCEFSRKRVEINN